LSLKNVVVSNLKRSFLMPFLLHMEISFLQQHCMANHSKILYYLLVVTLLICTQDFLSTYIHFFPSFFSVHRLQRLQLPAAYHELIHHGVSMATISTSTSHRFRTLCFTLLMYIILDVVSMYRYDLLFFQCRALCNIFNIATNIYYATTYIRIWVVRYV
jgi:hypothetical protein